jgi:hypothetical protein
MSPRRPSSLLVVVALLGAACLSGACREKARKAVEAELSKQGAEGSLRLLDDASADRYSPPADGKLTNRQVEVFLLVQRKFAGILRSEGASAKVDSGLEERLAKEAGAGGDELLWIRGRVVEALLARSRRDMARSFEKLLEDDLDQLRRSLEAASDPRSRTLVEERIRAVEEELSKARSRPQQAVDRGTLFNVELLAPHVTEIETLGAEIRRLRPSRGGLPGVSAASSSAPPASPASSPASSAASGAPGRGR